MSGIDALAVTANDVLKCLKERVSDYNARLILDSAMIQSGVQTTGEGLKSEDMKSLCLALIKQGGPAFQVGQTLYRKYVQ